MTTNPAPPCRTCGQPHNWTHAHGWRADNGHGLHAYDRREGDPVTIGRPRNDGNESALFGALESCGRCKALVEPADADAHEAWHLDVIEALGIAWKALNGGAGNSRNSDAREAG